MGDRGYLEIPYDILFQILLRLPVKSLVPLTSVCKAWRSMIFFDPDFTRAHYRITEQNPKSKHFIKIIESEVLSKGPSYFQWNVYLDETPVRLTFYDDTVLDAQFHVFASWNGILLVGFGEKDHYLWNPTTGSYKKLRTGFYHCHQHVLRTYSLWFDSACNAFKAIRMSNMKSTYNYSKFGKKIAIVRIYNSRTDSWKRIDDFRCEVLSDSQGLFWKGSPYWIVGSTDSRILIVVYFHDDEFKEIDFPVSGDYDIGLLILFKKHMIKLSVLNGLLHLIVDYRAWTMKQVGGSWIEWKDEFHKLDFDIHQQFMYCTYFETSISPHVASQESHECGSFPFDFS